MNNCNSEMKKKFFLFFVLFAFVNFNSWSASSGESFKYCFDDAERFAGEVASQFVGPASYKLSELQSLCANIKRLFVIVGSLVDDCKGGEGLRRDFLLLDEFPGVLAFNLSFIQVCGSSGRTCEAAVYINSLAGACWSWFKKITAYRCVADELKRLYPNPLESVVITFKPLSHDVSPIKDERMRRVTMAEYYALKGCDVFGYD